MLSQTAVEKLGQVVRDAYDLEVRLAYLTWVKAKYPDTQRVVDVDWQVQDALKTLHRACIVARGYLDIQ